MASSPRNCHWRQKLDAAALPPGSRYLVRGLQSRSDLNGTIVEIYPRSSNYAPPDHRVACIPVGISEPKSTNALDRSHAIRIKAANLVPAELEWVEEKAHPTYFQDGELCTSKAFMGCSCYSRSRLFVFGGMEECLPDADDSDEDTILPRHVGELMSYDIETKKWTMHWRPDLPGRTGGADRGMAALTKDPAADFSIGPPWMEMSSKGVLLHWTDPTGGRDILIFYCPPPDPDEADQLDENYYGEDSVDCVWIFRFPEVEQLRRCSSDFGYWVKISTAGSKPSSFQEGSSSRDARAEIFLDPNDDGVRIYMWGGFYCPPEVGEDNCGAAEQSRSSLSMNGMFELHIPSSHIKQTACDWTNPPQATWSLLPQKGSEVPMVRCDHSLTRVDRELVVLGGESIGGQPLQIPNDVGTAKDLGNWAYNVDTNEWRKLAFAPFGTARKPLECISGHLAFTLSNSRILVVRQEDDIYRHTQEEPDNAVLVYDLAHMTVHPMSTFSSSHNLRPPLDKSSRGRPLLGLASHWFHCGIFRAGGDDWRLLVHGRVTRDENEEGSGIRYISYNYDGSLFAANLQGMGRPSYESDERTPDWCRPGWALK